MKGINYHDIYSNGRKEIVLATGIPYGLIYTLQWNGKEFQPNLIANISQTLSPYVVISNLSYNILDVQAKDFENNGKIEIVVGGEADTSLGATFTKNSAFGWEATPYGFLIVYKFDGNKWNPQILDQNSVLGMTVGKLQIQ